MFKKKPAIKSLAPMRSSDRRKLADQIIEMYNLHKPSDDDANDESKERETASLTALRNTILPENTQSGKLSTTTGPTSKAVSLTVYVGGADGRVLWVRHGNSNSSSPDKQSGLWPTLYTLWHNPHLTPLLHTYPPVVAKLQAGAELMTPGLNRGPEGFPAEAKQGRVVAIGNTDKRGVPVAVGVCEIDVCNLGDVAGAKGVAVRTLMWVGDELWTWSASGKKGQDWESVQSWDDLAETAGADADSEAQIETQLEAVTISDPEPSEKPDIMDKDWTTPDIDKAFRDAFLLGVSNAKGSGTPPTYGLDFPIKQSFLMASLIQPHLPIFTPKDQESLHIKKSSFKNVRKFVKSLEKDKVVLSKERDNEAIIMDIDFDHPSIVNFKPYRLPKKASQATSAGPAEDDSDPSVGQSITITMLHRPKDVLRPLLPDLKAYYTASEIKATLTQYIAANPELPVPSNARLLTLNPFLADLLSVTDHHLLRSGSIPRDALLPRILQQTSPFYTISTPATTEPKPVPGQLPRFTLSLATRTGTKTVTTVTGPFGTFNIDPPKLADALRKACAGATSVDKAPGSSDKRPLYEVMVQGPQRDAVLRELGRRGVKADWVDVIDKTKGKRR